ncbi:hypothetical protein LXM94_15615 [Rhizobium sp. TRM95111]|nr:hypothetical protein [Rhizobium alarense]MCF3641401.1 hypothetical protein [Rhizobium alarense]
MALTLVMTIFFAVLALDIAVPAFVVLSMLVTGQAVLALGEMVIAEEQTA